MDFVRTTRSEAETALLGRTFGRVLSAAPAGQADIVLLDGPLGAGKTTFTRAVAAGMSLDTAAVSSPTFVLIHEYDAPAGSHPKRSLIHVDAYRLHDEEDLDSLGWDRVMARVDAGEAALIIEWAERLGPSFLQGHEPARIRIDHLAEEQREFAFTLPRAWASRPQFNELVAREPTRCPITGQIVPPESPTYPFSSERARLADLYQWFSGSYQITRPLEERDLEEGVD